MKQVHGTRAEWSGPSKHSILCSKHFSDDYFLPAASMGLKRTYGDVDVPRKAYKPSFCRKKIVAKSGQRHLFAIAAARKL